MTLLSNNRRINEELKRMIKEVPLDNKNKINPKVFQDMIKEIAKRKD